MLIKPQSPCRNIIWESTCGNNPFNWKKGIAANIIQEANKANKVEIKNLNLIINIPYIDFSFF